MLLSVIAWYILHGVAIKGLGFIIFFCYLSIIARFLTLHEIVYNDSYQNSQNYWSRKGNRKGRWFWRCRMLYIISSV